MEFYPLAQYTCNGRILCEVKWAKSRKITFTHACVKVGSSEIASGILVISTGENRWEFWEILVNGLAKLEGEEINCGWLVGRDEDTDTEICVFVYMWVFPVLICWLTIQIPQQPETGPAKAETQIRTPAWVTGA